MAKQVKVRYVYNAGAFECRDITVGCVYDAELPSFGEVDKDGAEVQYYDELWITKDDAGDAVVTRLSVGFELVEEQDDPLPPAPESVRYYNSFIMGNNDQNLTVEPAPAYPEEGLLHLLITPNSHSTRNVAPLSINMDPDAALQLAHDLTRMAMEIKRRERAQSEGQL